MKRQLDANSDFQILPLLTYKAAEKNKIEFGHMSVDPKITSWMCCM